MSDRSPERHQPRPSRRRPDPRRGRRLRHLPTVEGLEGRALMSYGGSPDFTFGTYGQVSASLPTRNYIAASASATQSNGQTLVAGFYFTPATTPETLALAVARYNADGSLDTTFGTDGVFTTPALTRNYNDDGDTPVAYNLAIQPDGRIAVVGDNQGVATVLRLDADGTLDTTFGTGGIVTLGTKDTADGKLDSLNIAAILADGQIAVGGVVEPSQGHVTPAVELLNANGSIASAFGTAGLAEAPLPAGSSGYYDLGSSFGDTSGMVALADGGIALNGNAVQGTSGNIQDLEIVTTEFTSTGTLDPAFGTGGQSVVTAQALFGPATSLYATTMAAQPDGKLVIGGATVTSDQMVTVLRLNANGALDPTFGINGGDILIGPDSNDERVNAMAFQPDGKIVVGNASNPAFSRFDANGLPDNSFGAGGTAQFPTSGNLIDGSGVVGVSVLADGKIQALLTGSGLGLVRMLGQGADNDYFESGVSDPAILTTAQSVFAASDPSGNTTGLITQFGSYGAGDTMPAPGAYSGGGIDEIGVYLPLLGSFAYRPYNGGTTNDVITPFGMPGYGNSLPAQGDYDGSGHTELAVYLPSLGDFIYRPSNGSADRYIPLGIAGAGQSIPVPADYFGTGQDDFAVYEPATGDFIIRNPNDGTVATIPFGTPGAGQSIPVPGDYDGSGHVELAVYLPASGELIYRPYNGGADVTVPFGTPGVAATIPAPGDYDGSGHTEVAGYDTSTGTFSYLPAGGGAAVSEQFGIPDNETVPFSMGTNAVAESGIGPTPPSPGVVAPLASAEIPLTPDVLDILDGTTPKKKAATG